MSYIGNQPTSVAFPYDTFSGTGSQTAFTMQLAPANTASVLVFVSGVKQDPSTYSVSGTTLTFSAAPPSGTSNISAIYLGIPASGVTNTAYRTITNFTATAGQTTFTPPSYTVGYIDVYRNGVKLALADFTATNGTTVVLASGATAGDVIETDSFYVSSVLNAIPATAGAVTTPYILDSAVTPAKLSQPFTSATAQATTSGTAVNFTGIPSWAKRITVMLNQVSTNSSSSILLQIGSGSYSTSGYLGATGYVYDGGLPGVNNYSTGFFISNSVGSGNYFQGIATLCMISPNLWTYSSTMSRTDAAIIYMGAGVSPTLSGSLDRLRITMVNGTDVFDNGSVNIFYE